MEGRDATCPAPVAVAGFVGEGHEVDVVDLESLTDLGHVNTDHPLDVHQSHLFFGVHGIVLFNVRAIWR